MLILTLMMLLLHGTDPGTCMVLLHLLKNDVNKSRRKPKMPMLKQPRQEISNLVKPTPNFIIMTLKNSSDCLSRTTLSVLLEPK